MTTLSNTDSVLGMEATVTYMFDDTRIIYVGYNICWVTRKYICWVTPNEIQHICHVPQHIYPTYIFTIYILGIYVG